jgi:hypothetical protein
MGRTVAGYAGGSPSARARQAASWRVRAVMGRTAAGYAGGSPAPMTTCRPPQHPALVEDDGDAIRREGCIGSRPVALRVAPAELGAPALRCGETGLGALGDEAALLLGQAGIEVEQERIGVGASCAAHQDNKALLIDNGDPRYSR